VAKIEKNKIKSEGGLRTNIIGNKSNVNVPLFSIITVVYNGEKHLEQTIKSVVNQKYKNFEYIIIDGGSTDGTLKIIEKYNEHLDYWVSEPDEGIYEAMNKGIQLARGELIGLINADDFYEPDALEKIAEAYRTKKIEAVYVGNDYILQDDLSLRYRHYATKDYWNGMTVRHQAMFVHRNIYRDMGGYSTDYRFASDYDFLLRIVAEDVALIFIDKFIVNYRNTGKTSIYYKASLREARTINRNYYGMLSLRHLKYVVVNLKSSALFSLQKIISYAFGDKFLSSLRLIYMKNYLLKKEDIVDDNN
jgi:glycosyltransferase involved in cell wall biosynthesis